MSLKDALMQDLKTAMKEKDTLKKSVITLVRAAIKQFEVDTRTEMDDEGILDIMAKQLKQKRDAIEEFRKGNREDLVEETENEIEILLSYLPKQLSEEEIRTIVKDTVSEVGATGPKDMGKVMSALMPKVKGKADGKIVSRVVKESLN